jgi:hypothetical protein
MPEPSLIIHTLTMLAKFGDGLLPETYFGFATYLGAGAAIIPVDLSRL